MKLKWRILSILAVLLLPALTRNGLAVDARRIDEVRNKQVLSSADMQVIDEFLSEAVDELVKTKQFDDIANVRSEITSRKSSQGQYARQFSESALRHIGSGLQKASTLPVDRQIKVAVNLLILIDQLGDLRLADLSLATLQNQNTVIRYWAVHSLTNPVVISSLNAGEADSRVARVIAERLSDLVESSQPEIIALMAPFAVQMKIPEGDELMLKIADTRIKQYAGWTVKRELLDSLILRLMGDKITARGPNRDAFARLFGQLYSYAIQRYIKGRDLLTASQKQQLVSVLVETEMKGILTLLGAAQTTIRRAIERNDFAALQQEHDRLIGSETAGGQLALKLKFDYLSPRGAKRTAPPPLPDAPAPSPGPGN